MIQTWEKKGLYAVGFACEMQRPSLELGKMFKEDRHERRNVVPGVFGSSLPILKVNRTMTWHKRSRRTTVSPYSAYENPTPTGWSTKKIFALSFQPYGLGSVLFGLVTLQGPGRQYRGQSSEL